MVLALCTGQRQGDLLKMTWGLDCTDRAGAVAELAQPLWGFKRGQRTFTWPTAELHRPAG